MEVNPNLTEKAKRDHKLVKEAVENGNQQAFTQLMDYYKDTIYFMLLKMTGSSIDAEDLAIEAFGKAFKNIEQYTPDYAFSTWLFKIASNNCIDHIRKKKKNVLAREHNEEIDEYEITKDITAKQNDPEETFIKEQKAELMREVVEKLKPRYRKLVELRYFQELTYDEICEVLQLPVGTVKAQLYRARQLLFNILKNSQEKI